ncbi:MAG: hypothetical protein J6C54_00960 [Lachnospiraceae bacterium]|nr:hypothetical protein [Lachnospiraceae bacterium]
MTTVFIKLLNMSITASWLILAVILLRIILKNAPKWIRCILWGLVAFRLICPISVESIFSLLPGAETIPQDILYVDKPTIHTGVMAVNSVVNPYLSESMAPGVGAGINPIQMVMSLGTVIWVIGMIGLLVYAVISYLRIKSKADACLPVRENIFLCDYIDTPFVFGIVRPRIYLPSALAEDDKTDFVIAHEKAHIRRRDHWWKPLGFLLLTIYWFNPVIWIAYILLCRDIELACDEYVIGRLKEKEKKSYSDALLACSMKSSGFHRNMISACPLSFGEVGVKDRVKAVLHYKRPAFWLVILGLLACIVAAICFLTDPTDKALHAPEPFGHSYRVEEVVYDDLGYSFAYTPDTAPRYQFTSDYAMFVSGDILDDTEGEEWVQLWGKFEEIKLSPLVFDDYFKNGTDGPTAMMGPDTLRKNTEKAWRIDVENDENDVFYYFILTKHGEVYLTYGYDVGDSYAANEEGSLIRWVLKLARTDILECNLEPEDILEMSYLDFRKLTEVDAEIYHANFYEAAIPYTDMTAIFLAEGWDENSAMAVLQEDDQVIRLEGKLNSVLEECTEDMSLEEFVNTSMWCDRLIDYKIEQGAGTAYYVAERYVTLRYDINGDSVADRMLQIELTQSGGIAPDSYCWLLSISPENAYVYQ